MIMIPLFVFLFAVFEAGWLFYFQATITHAAREGAKISVRPLQGGTNTLMTPDEVKAYVNTYLSPIGVNCLACTTVMDETVNACAGCSPARFATRRRVRVDVPYRLITLSIFSPLQFTMHGEGVMRSEISTW